MCAPLRISDHLLNAMWGATPTGTGTFKDGTTPLGTGTNTAGFANLTYTFTTTGAHSLTALQLFNNGAIVSAAFRRNDGRTYFINQSGAAFAADADLPGGPAQMLSAGAFTGWTYTNKQNEIETYNIGGKLTSITNRAGQTQTLTYSDGTGGANGGYLLDATGTPTTTVLPAGLLIRVTDPAGRTLQFGYDFGYDLANRVVKMTDPAGGVYRYGYTYTYTYPTDTIPSSNLSSVTYPDGKIKTYLYGEAINATAAPRVSFAHLLTGIVDENGNRFASWTYDGSGHATSSAHGALGSAIDHVSMVYGTPDASGNTTTSVTDAKGVIRSYTFGIKIGVVKTTGITGPPCDGCMAAYTYDTNGNIASRTDFKGNTACFARDTARNLELVRVEGLAPGHRLPRNPGQLLAHHRPGQRRAQDHHTMAPHPQDTGSRGRTAAHHELYI